MELRPLGKSGIEASVIGLGTWVSGGWMWGGSDDSDSIRAIQTALDCGINFIDTAPMYGFGHSEEVVGKAIAGRRDEIVLASKCGLRWDAEQGNFYFESEGRSIHRFLHPDSIRYEVEQSLKRLNTDRIDLLQTHWQDPTTPIEDTMATLLDLQQEGKILSIGVSNIQPDELERYCKVGTVASAQEKFSMFDRDIEEALIPYCVEHKVAILAYSPLAQGLLTGKITPKRIFNEGDVRNMRPRYSVENRRKVAAMLDEFQPIADDLSLTLTQLAIAWTISHHGITHALCGARTPEQAIENAKGAVRLSNETQAQMDAAIARVHLEE